MTTPEYKGWLSKKVNDNVPRLNLESIQSIKEYLQVIPSELEIIKQDFEKRNLELGKKIEQLEEEKMHLRLDVDVQKLEAEKLRKGKRKVEEDLDSLKTDYKKLHMSMRTTGLGKTSEQWRQEVQREKAKADQREKRFHDARARKNTLKKSLVEGQDEREMLVAQVAELEKTLHQHCGCNSDIELRASLSRIKDLKRKVEELESALQNCEFRIKFLESNKEQWKEQLRQSQDQVRDRDHIIGEAMAQIREMADHLHTLVAQADVLSVKYELESNQGREQARLLTKVKTLGIRAKSYI
ncbi:hypothetical protein PVK06_038786 [Gossypium arboreum]|uniref:Uncharacterized protein n=1 Tax=Gossypium arboreum TaxID=29729 RepID=A0ABR0N147_GOSAR|nr:hypothetical protein PVK06_038786 [Gossypium arboreum]